MKKKLRRAKRKLREKRKASDTEDLEEHRSSRKGYEKPSLLELTIAPAFPEWRRTFRGVVREAAGRH